MKSLLHKIILTALIVVAAIDTVAAQSSFSLNPVPLYKPIQIDIVGSDNEVLYCYNLYGFEYTTDDVTVSGEFIVPVENDTFKNKDQVTIKLGTVKEFAIAAGNNCRKIPVSSGIQLKYPNRNEKVYLNFDPDGPDPVFIPCK